MLKDDFPWDMSTEAGATRRRGKEANGSNENLVDGLKVSAPKLIPGAV